MSEASQGGDPIVSDQRAAVRDRWRWLRHLLLPLICLAMLPMLNSTVEEDSPTSDEWAHFVRGVSYWTTGDTKLSFAHPPLANAVAGIPFIFEKDVPDLRTFKHWERGSVIGVYNQYTGIDYDRARAQLVRGRRMMFVFPLLLVCYVYLFCLSQFGWRTAAAAALLLAFNPNVIAHGSLITTDLPAALGYVVATGEFARYVRGPPSIWRLVTMSLAVGLAVLCKHSGILLVPALGGLGLIAAIKGWGVFAEGPFKRRVRRYFGHITATTLIVAFTVNAGYQFHATGMRVDEILAKPEPQYWISKPYKHEMLERLTPLDSLPDALRIPVPYTQMFGVTAISAQNKRGWFRSYFWGKQQPNDGHPLYFPVLLLTKTPLAVFALLLAGLVARRPRRAWPSPPTLVVAALLTFFLTMIVRSNLNMGMRHMMPAVPLLTILAARGFDKVCERLREQPFRVVQIGRVLLAAILVSTPVTALAAYPHYLGWFNAAVGRDRGHWISIIGEDWNQDLLRAALHAESMGYAPLYIVEHTTVSRRELEWSGVSYTALRCKGVPAPGSYVLLRAAVAKTLGDKCYRWAVDRLPIDDVNGNMYFYSIPEEHD